MKDQNLQATNLIYAPAIFHHPSPNHLSHQALARETVLANGVQSPKGKEQGGVHPGRCRAGGDGKGGEDAVHITAEYDDRCFVLCHADRIS